jgi:hypothetical protein
LGGVFGTDVSLLKELGLHVDRLFYRPVAPDGAGGYYRLSVTDTTPKDRSFKMNI